MARLDEVSSWANFPEIDRVRQALARMADEDVVARIWDLDNTLWKPDPKEITNRLGWLRIAGAMSAKTPRLTAFARAAQADGYTHALLLGMGGSSLAPEVFRKTFGVAPGYLDLAVLDSTDPEAVLANDDRLDKQRTLFIVSTKSGGTVETLSFFKYFYNRVAQEIGDNQAGEHFVAITDPSSSLADLAARYNFREIFLNDPNLGGRYSALSYFGLAPAALVGLDVPLLLERAAATSCSCEADVDIEDNRAAVLGAILGEMAAVGRNKATFFLSPAIASFGNWLEQLIAESTGKEGKGILPVVWESLGAPEAYGDDRLFIYLRLDGDATYDAGMAALEAAGQPVVQIDLKDLYDLGGQFFIWEMATAVAGHILHINPFDQPNVEATKVLTRQMVAEYKAHGLLPLGAPSTREDGIAVYAAPGDTQVEAAGDPIAALETFLGQTRAGDYIALQAYVQPTRATDAALLALRTRLRDRYRVATVMGYGPRFLHGTGQLHKGDSGRGLFVQITAVENEDVPIPDEAGAPDSSITFGVLKMAQALGDRQALLDAKRRVIRFHLQGVVAGLDHLADGV